MMKPVLRINFIDSINDHSVAALTSLLDAYTNNGVKKVVIDLTTSGGAVKASINMAKKFKEYISNGIEIEVYGVSQVDSSGLLFFSAASKRVACKGSNYLFHPIKAGISGGTHNASMYYEVAKPLKIDEVQYISMLADCGDKEQLTFAKLKGLMDETTVMDEADMVECGLADVIGEPLPYSKNDAAKIDISRSGKIIFSSFNKSLYPFPREQLWVG